MPKNFSCFSVTVASFVRLAVPFCLLMLFWPPLGVSGIASAFCGAWIAFWLRHRRFELTTLNIDTLPPPDEVDRAIARYDREMDEFLRLNTP